MRVMFIVSISVTLVLGQSYGDTVELRNGQVVNGKYIAAVDRTITFEVNGRSETFSVDEISHLTLQAPVGSPGPAFGTRAVEPQVSQLSAMAVKRPQVTVPAGTLVTVRINESVVLSQANVGRTFHGTVDEPVIAAAQTAISKGTTALVRVVYDRQAELTARRAMTVDLVAIQVGGQMIYINANRPDKKSSRLGSSLATGQVIVSTAAGAMTGATLGGPLGAAVGAAVGVSSNVVLGLLRKENRIQPETILYFVLQTPLDLR
jgi:hypothetical protein